MSNTILKLIKYGVSSTDDGDHRWKLLKMKNLCEEIYKDKKLLEKLKKLTK